MKQITKEVARQFFQLGDNKQEMLGADGKAIYPVETYLEIGKIIDLQESDIKQLEKNIFQVGIYATQSILTRQERDWNIL